MAKLCSRRREIDTMEMEWFLVHDENGATGVQRSQAEAEEFAHVCADQLNRTFYVTSCVATLTEHKPLVKVEPRIFEDEPSESYEEWHHPKMSKGPGSNLAESADDLIF